MNITIKRLAINALIAAIYVNLTLITSSFSYLNIQFRVAEILILLVFFRKDYIIGLTFGCFIANLFSPLGIYDALFGTLATLLSVILIAYSKRLFVATLYPVIINGLVVGAELYFLFDLPFWTSALTVVLGEFVVVSIFGYVIFTRLKDNDYFLQMIGANQNIDMSKDLKIR
jgi:uncharacterized membrane protein